MKISTKKASSLVGWLAVFSLALLLTGTAQAQTGSLTGQVKAADTGDPLAGAAVEISGPALAAKKGAIADEKGRYAIEKVPAGTYTLKVTHVGYVAGVVRKVKVAPEASATVDFRLETAPYALRETVVSASRHAENIIDAPASISKVDWKEAQRNTAAHSYSSLLKNIKGVDYTQTGMFAEAFNTRGFNAGFNTRMVTLLDGIPFSPPTGLTVVLPVAKDDVQDVEVIVGPGSALYGPDAVAGIVSVTSKDPRTSQGTTAAVSGGSRSLMKGRVRHAGLRGKWGWKVSADYQQARDFEKVNTFYNADSTLSATDDPDFDTNSMRGGIGIFYYPDTRSSLSLKVGASRSDLIDMLDSGRMHRKGLKEVYQQFTYTSPHLFANLHRRVETEGFSYTLHGYARNRLAGMTPEEARTAVGYTAETTLGGAEVRYTDALQFLSGIRFNTGADYRRKQSESAPVEGGEVDIYQIGFYSHAEVELNEYFRLVLAGRGDFPKTYDAQFSPRAALIYKPSPAMALRLTYNQAYRSPTVVHQSVLLPLGPDVYLRGNLHGFRFGTESGTPLPEEYARGVPSISPEKSTTFEAGLKGVLANTVFLDVSAYRSNFKDFISGVRPISDPEKGIVVLDQEGKLRTGELTYTYVNYGKRTVRGLDLGANVYFSDQVLLKGNASLVHAGSLKAATGIKQPFNTPGNIFNLTLSTSDLLKKGGTADLSMRRVSEFDFQTVAHVGTVPAYTVFDLSLGYQIVRGLVYNLTIKNLLDNKHIEMADAPRIGRLVAGELQYAF